MKRIIRFLLPLLLLALLLTACGGSSTPRESAVSNTTAGSMAVAPSGGWDYSVDAAEAEMDYDSPAAPVPQTASGLPANVKIIYTAHIQLESTEFDAASNALNALVARFGGWLENSSLDNYSRYRHASYTVRVPAENFESFCDQAGKAATLRNISRSSEDVSERYYDLESRLATQRTKLERLQELLSRAEDMEDIITLESAISDTELAIENLTGSLRKYDSLVGYSTVYIDLNEVYKATETETAPIGFWARLGRAFHDGTEGFVDGFQDFVIDLAGVWLGLLVFLAIVALIVFLIVRGVRKRKKAKAAQTAAPAPAPVPAPAKPEEAPEQKNQD